jgi:hypothetical protein
METPGFSIWIILILVVLLLLIMWGSLFLLLALSTWIIARTRLRDERPKRPDWED